MAGASEHVRPCVSSAAGWTAAPTSVAAANRDADAVSVLLEHGAGPDEGLSQDLIDQCVRHGSPEVALMLTDTLHGKAELPVAPVEGAEQGSDDE